MTVVHTEPIVTDRFNHECQQKVRITQICSLSEFSLHGGAGLLSRRLSTPTQLIAQQLTAMPPTGKGIKYLRSPQTHRTRSDSSLDLETQQQLLLDIEAFGDEATAAGIVKTRSIYRTSAKVDTACRTKFAYYQKLKEKDPKEYW